MYRKPLSVPKLIVYLLFSIIAAGVGMFLGAGAFFIYALTAWLGGLFFWTLAEYLIHRFLFHPWGRLRKKKLVPQLLSDHGRHHRLPEEMATGFWNPLFGIPLLSTIGAIFYLLIADYAFLFLSGFTLGYIGYILIHYAIHRRNPLFSWLAPLWRHHFLHHFYQPNKCFGVTTLFWDRLFGTWARSGEVEIEE